MNLIEEESKKKYLPWIEKYRPKNLEEIVGQSNNIECIEKLIKGESLPHLLFYGNSGTGKTSTILSIVSRLFGNKRGFTVMKLDASDDRGINSVRDEIKGFAEKKNIFNKGIKLIILDEADSMTFDAQFALRRIIEKYSDNTRFCFICNYENKIIPAIKSRCANFRFNPIDTKIIKNKLKEICKKENLKTTSKVLKYIAELSNGDLRKAINILQSSSMRSKNITEKLVFETAGIPNKKKVENIIQILTNKKLSFNQVHNKLEEIFNEGYSVSVVLRKIFISIYENKKIAKSKNFSYLISELADLESMVAKSTFGDLYYSALIAIFFKYR